jgi:hypothetical protein
MEIILYNNASDRRKLDKSITQLRTINAYIKQDTDVMRPVIDITGVNLQGANYCYIKDFGRYYYINQQAVQIGKNTSLTLEIDVLMSWSAEIKSSKVIAIRSSNNGHNMISDNIPLLANRNVIYKQFGGADSRFGSDTVTADTHCYLLTVINGGAKSAEEVTS